MRLRSIGLVASLLFAAGLACSLPGMGDVGNVATSVAATLSAVPPLGTVLSPEAIASEALTPEPPTPTGAPSILRIVYIDSGNVMLIEGGASPVPLSAGGDAETVRIASDGMKVVYTRRAAPASAVEMHSVNIDGSGDLAILTPATLNGLHALPEGTVAVDVSSFAWIPGSHSLVFNTLAIPEFVGLFKFDDLMTVHADTGAISTLRDAGQGGDFSISPDGQQIAFSQPDRISLLASDGTNLRPDLVLYPGVITYSEYQYYAIPIWDPSSTAAGVAIPSADPLGPGTTGGIWRIPVDGSPAQHLADIPGDFFFGQFEASALSPQLTDVGFLRNTAVPNVVDLMLAQSDGSGESPYANGSITWLGWSPFSHQFAFSFGTPMDMRLGTPGGGPIPLANGTDLRWINASDFLFLSGSYGAWTLNHGHVGGGNVPLASPGGNFVSFDLDT